MSFTLQILGQPSKGDAKNVNLGKNKGHSSAKAAWLRCMGFYKKKKKTLLLDHKLIVKKT